MRLKKFNQFLEASRNFQSLYEIFSIFSAEFFNISKLLKAWMLVHICSNLKKLLCALKA